MKCENCSHAEMCKWIDQLGGRGCDFLDAEQEPCELLIIKSDIFLHQDDRKKWVESIKREREKGVIILPPYFEPLLVPNDIEIIIEQEPTEKSMCDRNICISNEYNGIGCDECIVNKAESEE